MQRRTLIGLAGGTLVLGALLAWAFAPRPLEVELARAVNSPFETSIAEEARTRVPQRYTVSAPLAGQLARITLREGDTVEAGEVLATLTPTLAPLLDSRTASTQRARVEQGEAAVARAQAGVGRAEVALAQARTELNRTEQLAREGFVSPTQLETQRLALRAAQRSLEAAVQDRHVADHDLSQARAALAPTTRTPPSTTAQGASTQASSNRSPTARAPDDGPYAVRAPASGQVLKVVQTSAGSVAVGTPLIELGDLARLEVVAELLTTEALRAPIGAPVRIVDWGGPGELQGRLARIEPSAFTKVSALGVEEQRVNALVEITSPREQWLAMGDGFRVGVRIVTLQQADALTVPVSAVFPLADGDAPGAMAAFVLREGRARRVPVTLGGRNGLVAWVREGLAAGDAVIVYPPASLKDGDRVRARKG